MEFLCIDFINSKWYKTHKIFKEPLKDKNWFKNFCVKWNLSFNYINYEEIIDTLLELRDFLSNATNDICSRNTIDLEDINKINEYLKNFSFYKVLKKDKNKLFLRTIPIGSDLDLIIFEIVFSFAELITKYDIKRVKFCKNPECRWIFYDESRNHTRKWCDNTCATLMKVRRFRENRKYGKGKNSNKS